MAAASSPDLLDSYLGDPRPKPVPAEPKSCRGCGRELERLRRYAGYCRECVFGRAPLSQAPPTARLETRFAVLRHVRKKNRSGRTERYVVLQCACGSKPRTIQLTVWQRHRPRCCSACKLKEIDANGFEAEYAR